MLTFQHCVHLFAGPLGGRCTWDDSALVVAVTCSCICCCRCQPIGPILHHLHLLIVVEVSQLGRVGPRPSCRTRRRH